MMTAQTVVMQPPPGEAGSPVQSHRPGLDRELSDCTLNPAGRS